MAYFQQPREEQPHQQIFTAPLPPDDPYDDEDSDDFFDEAPQREALSDEQAAREDRYRMLAGTSNLIGVVVGTLVILGVVALLISLVSWVLNDMSQSFTLLDSWFKAGGS